MLGLLLLLGVAILVFWYAWLLGVTPASDLERIEADVGGTGAKVISVKRTGVRRVAADLVWVAGNPTYSSSGAWRRIYLVTILRPDGFEESYSVGVEAKLFGYRDLKRLDPRA